MKKHKTLEDFGFNPITDIELEDNRWEYVFGSNDIHYCNGNGKHSILLVFSPSLDGTYTWYEVSRDGIEDMCIEFTRAIVNKLEELNNEKT